MIINLFKRLILWRGLIISLSIRNFRSSYFGSVLGIVWVLIEPVMYVTLLWFFFTKAMKFQPPNNYPYVPWLITAMSLWNLISAVLSSSPNVFRNHAFLLKRPEFHISVLPIVNILTALYVHAIFIVILMLVISLNGVPFTLYWFQAFYYLFATCILLLGLSWIASTLSLFVKDVSNIIGVMLQIGFWISPIFWSLDTFPKGYRILLILNPVSYVMEGYRKSFLYAEPFWEDVNGFIYFWSFTLITVAIGTYTFKKMRPHFGDVL